MNWNKLWLKYRKYNIKKIYSFLSEMDILKIPKDKTMLDLGCGTGDMVQILSNKGYNIIGIEKELSLLRVNIKEDIRWGDCVTIRFTNKFDIIFLVGVLHHLKSNEISQLFTNIKTMLNKDGVVYISEPRDSILRRLMTTIFLRTPLRYTCEYLRLESILWKKEKNSLERWYNLWCNFQLHYTLLDFDYEILEYKTNWKNIYLKLEVRDDG